MQKNIGQSHPIHHPPKKNKRKRKENKTHKKNMEIMAEILLK